MPNKRHDHGGPRLNIKGPTKANVLIKETGQIARVPIVKTQTHWCNPTKGWRKIGFQFGRGYAK